MAYGRCLWVGTNGPEGIHILQEEKEGWRSLLHGGPAAASYLFPGPDGYVLAAVEAEDYEGIPGGAVVSCLLEEDAREPRIRISGAAKGLSGGICHVTYAPKRKLVFAASYPHGSVDVLKLERDGRLEAVGRLTREGSGPLPEQAGPHAHCCAVTKKEELLYVCDLGTDEIARYELTDWGFSRTGGCIRPVDSVILPPGTGPRHLVLSEDEAYLYVACELSNRILRIRSSDGALLQSVDCRPRQEGFCALSSIRFSIDRESLIAGCRGMEGIWVVPLLETGELGEPNFYASASSFPWDVLPLDGETCAAAFTRSHRVEIGRCREGRWEIMEACKVHGPTCLVLSEKRKFGSLEDA